MTITSKGASEKMAQYASDELSLIAPSSIHSEAASFNNCGKFRGRISDVLLRHL
jgi:hypothetical protein